MFYGHQKKIVFRTLPNTLDEAFFKSNLRFLVVNYFHKTSFFRKKYLRCLTGSENTIARVQTECK